MGCSALFAQVACSAGGGTMTVTPEGPYNTRDGITTVSVLISTTTAFGGSPELSVGVTSTLATPTLTIGGVGATQTASAEFTVGGIGSGADVEVESPSGLIIDFFDGGANACNVSVSVLPVELVLFKAIGQEENVMLRWETASEQDNAGFEIERSVDGQDWETLDFVKGFGTSLEAQRYKWMDDAPASGFNYYRLKQIDYDGTYGYSEIVLAQKSKQYTEEIAVFPNPVEDVLYYELDGIEAEQNIFLYDIFGQLIHQEVGVVTNTIDLNDVSKGIYFLVIHTEMGKYRQRFVKQ